MKFREDLKSVGVETLVGSTQVGARLAVPVRINLLPHREARREQRRKNFMTWSVLMGVVGLGIVLVGGLVINQKVASQQSRNAFLTEQNAALDKQIADVALLREEIAALRARQKAVESLQSDRSVPVHLFSELTKVMPERVMLRHLKQEDKRVALVGLAQTNDGVAEFLHNLAERSPWLERPELGEIKDASAVISGQKEARRAFEFSLNVLIRQPEQSSTHGGSPSAGQGHAVGALAPTAAVSPKFSQ